MLVVHILIWLVVWRYCTRSGGVKGFLLGDRVDRSGCCWVVAKVCGLHVGAEFQMHPSVMLSKKKIKVRGSDVCVADH